MGRYRKSPEEDYIPSKEVREERIFEIYKRLCKGDSRARLLRESSVKWGVSGRTIDKYIKQARDLMKDDFAMDREAFAIEILAGYRDLRARAIEDKQYSVALGCLSRMAAITNVDGNNCRERAES